MQSGIPIEEFMWCHVFFHTCNLHFVIRIIVIFYLALIHPPKFIKGQGQTSVI